MIHKVTKGVFRTYCGLNTGGISPHRKSYDWDGKPNLNGKRVGVVNCPICMRKKTN